jgi:hypothetical protein
MAIVSFQLDPNAAAYTDDQIVGKINTATANITRSSSVAAAARPIVANEITDTELAAGVAKTNLDAMADTARGYIKTSPTSGEFPVVNIQRDATGNLDIDYDNVAV